MVSTSVRAVAGVVALALAVLPSSVAVCAVLCAPSGSAASVTAGSAAHAHHSSVATRHERSADPRLLARAVSVHVCGDHDGNMQRSRARLTRPRTATGALWVFDAHALPRAAIAALIAPHRGFGHDPPPGPSRSVTPLVLRL